MEGPETPDPSPAEARRLVARLEAAAAKAIALVGEDPRGTWACADCEDTGWVMVPCSGRAIGINGRERACTVCPPHLLARDCRSCAIGIDRIAGRWVTRVHRKKAMDDIAMEKFKAFLLEQHPVAADKIRTAFDRILTREKGDKPKAAGGTA